MANTNRIKTFILTGGEDFVTSSLEIKDGMARVAFNYEQDYNTGYTRIAGYRHLVSDTDPTIGATPGEGSILGTVVYDNSVYIFQNKIGGVTAGFWKATPDVWDDTVSPATRTSQGSWTEITNIDDSTGSATTLQPDGYYEFVIHNFKATTDGYGAYRGDWVARTDYTYGDIVTDAAGSIDPGAYDYITHHAHTSSPTSMGADSAQWERIQKETDVAPADAHDVTGNVGNLYGVDGKNPSFEFNGTTLTQIDTGYDNDTPLHIEATGNRLIIGFRFGELAISRSGLPTDFDAVFGAGNNGVSDFLTGMMAGPDGVLYVFTKDKTYLYAGLAGPLEASEMKKHNKNVGAYPYTQQMLAGQALFYDTWGITNLQTTEYYGDVITNAISSNIQVVLAGQQPQASLVLREKAQYRLFFRTNTTGASSSDTTCIIGTAIKGKSVGFTHAVYPFDISTATSGEVLKDVVPEEWNIAGDQDGNVWRLDAGTSFNGEEYNSYITLPFNYLGSPGRVKKFRKVSVNIEAESYISITGSVNFSFGANGGVKDIFTDLIHPGGGRWGQAVWSEFFWGEGYTDFVETYINGHGQNVSLTLSSTSATDRQHTLKDVSYIYQYQRMVH